jgi:hypothetical protein
MNQMLRTSRVFVAVVFLGLFAMTARNVTDPDVWWHLKAGQYIAEHRSVPHTDPFSYTRAGQPWVAHEWLTELLLYGIERVAGWGGLIAAFSAVLCAAFYLLYLRCGSDPYVAGVAALYAAWATIPVWGVRPQVLSLLLTSLWLFILGRSERNPKLLWWTPPLMLLWVNLHAGFALGLALSALFLIGEWIEQWMGGQPRSPRLRNAAFILLLNLLIVPLNPNGLRMFSYPIETLRSAAMQNYIAEWASPNFHRADYLPFLLVVLGAFAALSGSRSWVRPRDLLLLIVSLYAGLCSIRMMPLFVLIAVPLICQRLAEWPTTKPLQRLRAQAGSGTLFNAVIVLAMAAFAGFHIFQVVERQPQAESQHFPLRAATFLQTHPAGRIFNHYDWGGYLVWRLYPSTPVFIDGRADLYGEKLLDQFAETYQFKSAWQRTLQEWNIDTVLVPVDSALATGLRNSPGWSVSYEDTQAVVFTASAPAKRAEDSAPLPLVSKKLHLPGQFAGYYE